MLTVNKLDLTMFTKNTCVLTVLTDLERPVEVIIRTNNHNNYIDSSGHDLPSLENRMHILTNEVINLEDKKRNLNQKLVL